jgi:HJR/Mrr/RecB family endonuclease
LRVVGKNFKELKVWQKANELCFEMYNITKDFSSEKKLGLTLQNSLLEKLAKVKNVIKSFIKSLGSEFNHLDPRILGP